MLGAKEVMEIVRRVWPRAASMLSPVFACDAPGLLGGAPTLPVGAALDVFFLKAVSVPPNKFRPPSFMNGVVRKIHPLISQFPGICLSPLMPLSFGRLC